MLDEALEGNGEEKALTGSLDESIGGCAPFLSLQCFPHCYFVHLIGYHFTVFIMNTAGAVNLFIYYYLNCRSSSIGEQHTSVSTMAIR